MTSENRVFADKDPGATIMLDLERGGKRGFPRLLVQNLGGLCNLNQGVQKHVKDRNDVQTV